MKILKEKSREYKGKSYFKYKVNIPEEKLKEANLKEGDDLEIETKKNKIILYKRNFN
ncbi:MAG: AbrB/MazE/SpoVT family DNA-binding domain-containing protein [Nanoarchaeota archaeon]